MAKFKSLLTSNLLTCGFSRIHQRVQDLSALPVSLAYASYDPEGLNDKTSPIFILHGLFGSKLNWNTMAKNLSLNTNRRVLAVDLRNHGESPHAASHTYLDLAADIKYLMDELGIEPNKSSFIGHSMGGRAAMTLLLANPELARDLIVVDISPIGALPHVESQLKIYSALKAIRLEDSLSLAEMRKKAFDALEKDIQNEGLRKFLLVNLIKEKDKFRWKINLNGISKERNLELMPEFVDATFDKPTLFLCGERSDYVPHDHHKKIYKIFPKSRFEYFQDTGHLPHAERPEQFLRVASEFLNKNYTVK
ncbi:unnamed protein product [Nesidiocoris tenuis]|uniref:PGAP1-like protein n=2 Tax=Nesidiocoris tenuis TaxID=355587 RepID=A0ABN7B5W8_9HEMI|nr:PGAP1-like protein [Nesidiocoris tenuis]CAB0004667.1 unnamed protein product [Nesidiocoris tenuis]